MTISSLVRLVLLAAVLTGCATSSRPTSTSQYLQTPARAGFREPLTIQVQDERSLLERQPASPSGYYLSTADAGAEGRVPTLFAQDLSRVLQTKKMAAQVHLLDATETAPPGATVLRIRLVSWFGQVPQVGSTAKISALLLGNTTFYAKGQCQFEAGLFRKNSFIDLGKHEATVPLPVDAGATVAREGRAASARAADEAIAGFVRKLETYLNRMR